MNFFDTVKAEMRDPFGLNKLVWKVNWGQYPEGSLIMCSRQMRRWLLKAKDFADHYSVQKDKLQCMKKALNSKTTLDGQSAPSYINQYKRLILDGDNAFPATRGANPARPNTRDRPGNPFPEDVAGLTAREQGCTRQHETLCSSQPAGQGTQQTGRGRAA